jgi:ABC-2 type transport system permease protein/oleandomycin transport system permease protein
MSATRTTAPTTKRGNAINDAMIITWRNLMQFVRVPPLLVFSVIQPIMFVLLFVVVFGGSMKELVGGSYVNYLMPGILVQTTIFGSTQTGVGLAEDLNKGFIDRFRSLPMARSAVLAGRTTSDMVRNLVVITLMVIVGLIVGFRPDFNPFYLLLALVLGLAFGHAFSWISATIGLAIKDVESVQAASFTWVFPLTFLSSAFVPVDTLPSWLQPIVKLNPVTVEVNAIRSLVVPSLVVSGVTSGGVDWSAVAGSILWTAGLLLVFTPLAIRQYRSLT